ncbi:SIMPL domain-containing protein [Winogradskyella sp.]|uniref:SIMPL domain-containing protein n=1 Tax=Winogradskyella sp. TaxID=1883156 RepID=UPI003BA949A2
MKAFLVTIIISLLALSSTAQIAGNQLYGKNSHHNYNIISNTEPKIVASEKNVTFTVDVLMNAKPDFFKVVLGAHQEGKTVIECNDKINERIEGLKKSLKRLNITEKDIYVDFITQNKIYDYQLNQNVAEQIDMGYEIKKNIIIEFNDISIFDELVSISASHSIFDIIKVDYFNTDQVKIYDQLFEACLKVVDRKKNMYEKYMDLTLSKRFSIVSENSSCIMPKIQYRDYKAFEASDVSTYNTYNKMVKKDLRKRATFFYEGTDISRFDHTINPEMVDIPIQYALRLKLSFRINE